MKIQPDKAWTYSAYAEMITSARDAGLNIHGFRAYLEQEISDKRTLLCRHDIDFNLDSALNFAQFENKMNIKSTYFLRVCASNYNLASSKGLWSLKRIEELGHEIGLHLDIGMSKVWGISELESAQRQFEIFKELSGNYGSGFSLHMPGTMGGFDLADQLLDMFKLKYHAYQDRFTEQSFKYVSDSMKLWREKPFSELILENQNLQFLTHPIWWFELIPQENF
jgi:hypothetical protein